MGKFCWLLPLVIFFLIPSCVSGDKYEIAWEEEHETVPENDNPLPVRIDTIIHGSFECGTNAPFGNPYPGGTDVIEDTTAPDGKYVIRFKYPRGLYGGSAPNIVGKVFPSQLNEFWAQYYFKYSADWRWNTILNKQVYITMGAQGNADPNFFIGANHYGSNMYMTTQVPPDGTLNQAYKTSGFSPAKNRWYKVNFHVKMNIPGEKDGIFQLWMDNELKIDVNNVMFRKAGVNSGYGFVSFQMTPVYGGGKEEIPAEQYLYFDHVVVQTAPFSGLGGSH